MSHSNNSQILPGVGVGELRLGDSEQVVLKQLGDPVEKIVMPSGVARLNFGEIQVWLDDKQQVMQIGLINGYKGQTSDGIRIGLSKVDLTKIWGFDLAYHEDDEYWEYISRPGTLFEFVQDESGVERIKTIYICKP